VSSIKIFLYILIIGIVLSAYIFLGTSTKGPPCGGVPDTIPASEWEKISKEDANRVTITAGESKSSETIYHKYYPGDPVEIRKFFSPASKDGYLIGAPIRVL